MSSLSLTFPISCHICLGKVKDPVLCQNNHTFCITCLDTWLQKNNCCPTCRIEISQEKPYKKVIGSNDYNPESLSLEMKMQLRKTRMKLLSMEYETEIESLSEQLKSATAENEALKKNLKNKEAALEIAESSRGQNNCNINELTSLTKKLQEISKTYDDVLAAMSKLQKEKEQLQKDNICLKKEVSKLKEDSMFTKSPQRYEKFMITGLKAKIDTYEKENQQLKKALENSDKYAEELQFELESLRKACDAGKTENTSKNNAIVPVVQNKMQVDEIAKYSSAQASHETYDKSILGSGNITVCNTQTRALSSGHKTNVFTSSSLSQSCESVSRDLFPATKKLLALKKIHENKPDTFPQTAQDPSSLISSIISTDEVIPSSNGQPCLSTSMQHEIYPEQGSGLQSCSFAVERTIVQPTRSCNIFLTAAGPKSSCQLLKRNTSVDSSFLQKKIKVEKT